jgi:hypothetical protein
MVSLVVNKALTSVVDWDKALIRAAAYYQVHGNVLADQTNRGQLRVALQPLINSVVESVSLLIGSHQ